MIEARKVGCCRREARRGEGLSATAASPLENFRASPLHALITKLVFIRLVRRRLKKTSIHKARTKTCFFSLSFFAFFSSLS